MADINPPEWLVHSFQVITDAILQNHKTDADNPKMLACSLASRMHLGMAKGYMWAAFHYTETQWPTQ